VKISDIQHTLETWAPPGTAWKDDNIGLQIGRPHTPVTNILITLDVTMRTVHEAVRRKANFIVSHHPLIFQPFRSISDESEKGAIALSLCEKKINLFAAHTNLDSAPNGVNHVLAGLMGLRNISVLSPIEGSMTKVAVFVPTAHLEKVAAAMHAAGGGQFRKYQECSFRTEGIGTFKARNHSLVR
jgi:putative NIF3 family GTP cyclohydrolase 1 type 2